MFDDKMYDKEIKSLSHQLKYVYGINRRTDFPAQINVTGVGHRLEAQLKSMNYEKWLIPFTRDDYIGKYPKEKLVYLTADSKEVIDKFEADKIYIIGGIVDRNRYKMITYDKAMAQGIKTAKLPISEHIDIKATNVLTVNLVFEIIIRYIESKNWTKAFMETLPLKKHATSLKN